MWLMEGSLGDEAVPYRGIGEKSYYSDCELTAGIYVIEVAD